MRLPIGLFGFLLLVPIFLSAQSPNEFRRDSVYREVGINGSTDFRPESRTYFPQYDEQGRVLLELTQETDGNGNFRPFQRRQFEYTGPNLTMVRTQLWVPSRGEWIDRRLERFQYGNGRLEERLRQVAPNDVLRNDRRWQYRYNQIGLDTSVVLQQWTGNDWENLSRLRTGYAPNGNTQFQMLQLWHNGQWQGVRRRLWQYAGNGNNRAEQTTVQIWSLSVSDWVNQSRQVIFYEDGRWVSSRYEDWNDATNDWENANRQRNIFDADDRPEGQLMEVWDGEWVNAGRAFFQFQNREFNSLIQQWDRNAEVWDNFLRYRLDYTPFDRIKRRTGMQAWNPNQEAWLNRDFTQRITHFYSDQTISSISERSLPQSCTVPNPYPVGTPFHCDDLPDNRPLLLELTDLWGRTVYSDHIAPGQSYQIDTPPASGVYVLRIRDNQRLYHLQRLIIP